MVINKALLKEGIKEHFSEDVDFSSYIGDSSHCKKINSCHIELDALLVDEILMIWINGTSEIITSCKYTLEYFPLSITFKDVLSFNDNKDDEDSFYEPNIEIDLNPYILGLILDKIPHNIAKKGAKRPENGNGYRILSEDELEEEKKTKKDPRWAALDDIEI